MAEMRLRPVVAPKRIVLLAAALAAASGCAMVDVGGGVAVERPPELLSAGNLELPADCAAEPGAVYRTEYVVDSDGAVDRVTQAEGPACVQLALAEWVRTFRHSPGTPRASATVDWMVTVARRDHSP